MRFEIAESLVHPPDAVYRALRDELPALLPLLPNVDSIEVLRREEEGPGCVHVVSRWTGRGSVPWIARPFVPRRYLSWIDDARWEDGERLVRWRIQTALPDVVSCAGVNSFRAAARGGTDVVLTGELRVDLARMRGVPSALHGAAPRVAAYLVERLKPNLVDLTRAVDRLLSARG